MNHPHTSLQIQEFSPDQLFEYARNPRKNDDVVDKMCAAIGEFGFRIPIIAKSNGQVVDGHLRLKAARKLGLEKVPVILADDLSEAQIKAFRLLANRSANWASWDEELLKVELEELKELDFSLEHTGFSFKELEDYLAEEENENQESEETFENQDVEENEIYTPITKQGDLWVLGSHLLYCGDSTAAEAYSLLFEEKEKADLVVCDPPYNVNYEGGSREMMRHRTLGLDRNSKTIRNDNLGEEFESFLVQVCSMILSHAKGAVYICMASSELGTLRKVFTEAGGHISTFIIWAKSHFAISLADYHQQYEPILYGWPKGIKHYWCGARDQSNLWQIDKPAVNALHPTQKPVALMEKAIINSSRKGDTVLDPFGGSDSTLMACEYTKRKCRMIELEPKYCDTIIKRWQNYTGKEAVLQSTKETFSSLMEKTK